MMKIKLNTCIAGVTLMLLTSRIGGSSENGVTNDELAALSEQLFTMEVDNNANEHVVLDLQGNASSTSDLDEAARLLLKVDLTALSLPTIQKLTALHDNYHADTSVKEEYSIRDLIEITNFVDALFETRTMQTAQKFLQTKNLPNGRDNFLEMWFGLYQRGAENSSSGFEHVFLGEIIKGKEVSGLHNWVFFNREEKSKLLDYMGHMSFTCLGTKGSLIELAFKWKDARKPISSMFIGTSPELELALFTVCFYSRPNATCPVSLAGKALKIQTFGKGTSGQFVATSYPVFPDSKSLSESEGNCHASGSRISSVEIAVVIPVAYLITIYLKLFLSIFFD